MDDSGASFLTGLWPEATSDIRKPEFSSAARITQPYKGLYVRLVLLDSDSWLLDALKSMTDPEVLCMIIGSKLRGIKNQRG
ncbi:MAG: hypothetical protein JRJ03_04390 [Deltaproteobacteria bacterium]|nr:hypothetical protein [Deltaproteobacteria bacterium]